MALNVCCWELSVVVDPVGGQQWTILGVVATRPRQVLHSPSMGVNKSPSTLALHVDCVPGG